MSSCDPGRVRAVAVPAVAVAVLAAACTSCTSASTPPGTKVACRYAGSGDIQDVLRVLSARAEKIAAASARVSATVSGSTVTTSIEGVTPDDVRQLCISGSLEFRPLVAPAKPADLSGPRTTLSGLGFTPPSSEPAYDRLSATQRSRLDGSLARATCPQPAAADAPVVACGDALGDGKTLVALLGPAIVTGDRVAQATALAPGASTATGWSIRIDLDPTGRRAWADYTTAHNSNEQTADVAGCGDKRPSADWVGFVLDGRLLSLPVTYQPILGSTQVTAALTKTSARQLAAALEAGQISGRLSLVSMTRTP